MRYFDVDNLLKDFVVIYFFHNKYSFPQCLYFYPLFIHNKFCGKVWKNLFLLIIVNIY